MCYKSGNFCGFDVRIENPVIQDFFEALDSNFEVTSLYVKIKLLFLIYLLICKDLDLALSVFILYLLFVDES